ncbi:urease accessory protein UreF [Pseudoxanthobacter soli]|nr:urease accessory UreF family protein [Pseudoxanthobacter soli]
MSAHLPMMVWMSPAFPVGGFAYSHGLEWAAEAGDLKGADDLREWLGDLLFHGGPRNDAILFRAAFLASGSGDNDGLREAAELALAFAGSRERRLETVTQGNAFVIAATSSWPCAALDRLKAAWDGDIAYPVAVAVTAAGHGLALHPALEGFLVGVVGNLVSAAVRLGVVGQTGGQQAVAALVPAVERLAALVCGMDGAAVLTLDDLGGAAFRSDISALRHETQYTRLFRS